VENRTISNAVNASATTSNAAFFYSASIPTNSSFYTASDKEAVVLRTGDRSADFHEVAGPMQFRVSHRVGNRYTGPENDFHTNDQQESTSHTDRYTGNVLS